MMVHVCTLFIQHLSINCSATLILMTGELVNQSPLEPKHLQTSVLEFIFFKQFSIFIVQKAIYYVRLSKLKKNKSKIGKQELLCVCVCCFFWCVCVLCKPPPVMGRFIVHFRLEEFEFMPICFSIPSDLCFCSEKPQCGVGIRSYLVKAVHRKSGTNQLMQYKGRVVNINVPSQMQHGAATRDPVPLSPRAGLQFLPQCAIYRTHCG